MDTERVASVELILRCDCPNCEEELELEVTGSTEVTAQHDIIFTGECPECDCPITANFNHISGEITVLEGEESEEAE